MKLFSLKNCLILSTLDQIGHHQNFVNVKMFYLTKKICANFMIFWKIDVFLPFNRIADIVSDPRPRGPRPRGRRPRGRRPRGLDVENLNTFKKSAHGDDHASLLLIGPGCRSIQNILFRVDF
jgi:hypothetical protein